jgi:hypothetical protein
MSINQFKHRYGFGRTIGEKVPDYETFFTLRTDAGELRLDRKKRYIRIFLNPEHAAVLLSRKAALKIARAIVKQLDGPEPVQTKDHQRDGNGIKCFVDIKDGQGIRVRLRESDSGHAFIETGSIPHLRSQDAWELVSALRAFAK